MAPCLSSDELWLDLEVSCWWRVGVFVPLDLKCKQREIGL